MKVYIFDLLAYDHHFEDFKAKRYMPYPLPGRHFDPEIAARTYDEHLEAWEEMDRLGYDGVGLNEHHTTPHGLMNSPNMMAAVAAQRTKKLKFLMLGNLLPAAQSIAYRRGIGDGRFAVAWARDVGLRARCRASITFTACRWRNRVRGSKRPTTLSSRLGPRMCSPCDGKFWSYKDIAIWPRPYQRPHPPIWVPFTGSKETIGWAGKHNLNAVLPDITPGLTEDIVGYFAKALAKNGHRITPDHLCLLADAYVTDSKEAAVAEYSPSYLRYFTQALWHHGSITETGEDRSGAPGYTSSSSYVRPENRDAAQMDRGKIRNMTLADVEKRVAGGKLNFGPAKEVAERLIHIAESAGANSVLLNMNVGAMPHRQFMEQIRRFGREVLPKFQAHQIKRVPAA